MEVNLDGDMIKVQVIRKKNKNIYFRFDEKLNLVVTANKWVSEREIGKLIENNKKSLEKLYVKVQNKQKKINEFWYLGNKYELIYDDDIEDLEFNNGRIICKNEGELNKFLKFKTKEIFTQEVYKMCKIIETPDFELKIRKMKSRWGVCNYQKKTITLNSELIKYSRDILQYVIVHEMCHFYHHNHGNGFWEMVSNYYPNYKLARKELRS